MNFDQRSLDSTDFARLHWRSAVSAPSHLPELLPGALDEATVRQLAENLPALCWVARGDGYIV